MCSHHANICYNDGKKRERKKEITVLSFAIKEMALSGFQNLGAQIVNQSSRAVAPSTSQYLGFHL